MPDAIDQKISTLMKDGLSAIQVYERLREARIIIPWRDALKRFQTLSAKKPL